MLFRLLRTYVCCTLYSHTPCYCEYIIRGSRFISEGRAACQLCGYVMTGIVWSGIYL